MAHVRPKPDKINQPNWRPTRKVASGAASSVPLAIVIGWLAARYEVDLPQEVALAITALLGSVGTIITSYFTRDRA